MAIVDSDVEIYKFSYLPYMGGNRIGGFLKQAFISSKVAWCSDSHLNPSSLFKPNSGEKAFVFPLRFKMNLLRKLIFPSNNWSYFLVKGGFVSSIALVLFWFIFIPVLWTTKPSKSHASSQKGTFYQFIFYPYFLILFE